MSSAPIPTVLAPRPTLASARSAVAKFVIGSPEDEEDEEDEDDNDGPSDAIDAELEQGARIARLPIVHTTDGSCLNADEKSTQRDSVLGASESHDQLTPGSGPSLSVGPSPLYSPLSTQAYPVHGQSEVDMLSALPPPSYPKSAPAASGSTVSSGLWSGRGDRNAQSHDVDVAQQPAIRDIVARRFDLQPKRRWTALPEPDASTISLSSKTATARALQEFEEQQQKSTDPAHFKISLPTPPPITSVAVASTTAPPTPLQLPEASETTAAGADAMSLLQQGPASSSQLSDIPAPATLSPPTAMLWQREISTK